MQPAYPAAHDLVLLFRREGSGFSHQLYHLISSPFPSLKFLGCFAPRSLSLEPSKPKRDEPRTLVLLHLATKTDVRDLARTEMRDSLARGTPRVTNEKVGDSVRQ